MQLYIKPAVTGTNILLCCALMYRQTHVEHVTWIHVGAGQGHMYGTRHEIAGDMVCHEARRRLVALASIPRANGNRPMTTCESQAQRGLKLGVGFNRPGAIYR